MRISARNSLKGTIKSITKGAVNAEVVIDIGNGVLVTYLWLGSILVSQNKKFSKFFFPSISYRTNRFLSL